MRFSIAAVALLMLATLGRATVIRPDFAPGLSVPDAHPGSPGHRLVDNSGMTPDIHSGAALAETLRALHVISGSSGESWETIDPPPMGGSYFADSAIDPELVFDLGSNRLITDLFFWQFQRLGPGASNGAREVEVRFAPDPGGGMPAFPVDADMTVTLEGLVIPNRTQVFEVATPATARFIKLTVTDNFGGPRVGMGEFRVAVGDHPSVELPAEWVVNSPDQQQQQTFEVPLANVGTPPEVFSVVNITFQGADAGLFGIDFPALGPFPIDVPGESSLLIPVLFTPPPMPPLAGIDVTMDVEIGSGGGGVGPFTTYSMTLAWYEPHLSIEDVEVGSFPRGVGPQPFQYELENLGLELDLEVVGIELSAGDTANFGLDVSSPAGIYIFATASALESGTFDPLSASGPLEATALATSNPVADGDSRYREFKLKATVLDDLAIDSPPRVSVPPLGTGSTSTWTVGLDNDGPERDYELDGGLEILESPGGTFSATFPSGEIGGEADPESSRQIQLSYTHDGSVGLHRLNIRANLTSGAALLSRFQLPVTIRVGDPVRLEAVGFNSGGDYVVRVSGILPGEELHLEGSGDLVDWEALPATVATSLVDSPNLAADAEVELGLDSAGGDIRFIRVAEGWE